MIKKILYEFYKNELFEIILLLVFIQKLINLNFHYFKLIFKLL